MATRTVSLVGSFLWRRIEVGCEQHGLNQVVLLTARYRNEIIRLAITGGDRFGVIEDQCLDVAGRLARHRRHIEPHRAVDVGNADGGEQSADRPPLA
jgi:hypothetical protein